MASESQCPINLDDARGLDSAQLQMHYDASALEVEGVGRRTLTGDFQAFVVLNDPGLLQLDMASINPLAGGSGSLAQIELRATNRAAPGSYALDLERGSLDAGRLILTPLPVPGVDGTDGSVAIEGRPGIATQKAASRPASLIPPANLANASGSIPQRSANVADNPVIDWSARVAPSSRPAVKEEESWAKDFVVNLGQSDKDRNPNDKLRLPAAVAAKAKVSARTRT